jgi:hypothetical protein
VPRATPGKITSADILAMWAACYSSSRRRAVWVTSQDVETQMMTMFLPVTDGTGNIVNGFPTYLPPGGLSQAPYGTLMGRPVIATEAAPPLGSKGDIALLDLQSYLSVQKVSGIKQDISIHLWFDYDVTCFRFVIRLGGGPFWKTPLENYAGTAQRSPFVLLDGTVWTPPSLFGADRRKRELEEAENQNATAASLARRGQTAAVYQEHEATKRSNEQVAAAEKDRADKQRKTPSSGD